jgi:hypothetical protein
LPALYRQAKYEKLALPHILYGCELSVDLREGCKLWPLENSVLRSWLQENKRNCILRSFIMCKGKGHLGDLYIDGRILLKRMLMKL